MSPRPVAALIGVASAGALLAAALGVALSSPARAQAQLPTGLTDQLMADTLSQPVGMTFLPDGRLLVLEQLTANVRMLAGPALSPLVTVGTIPGVNAGGERGLLGIAVDPRWPAKPYLYVHCTSTDPPAAVRISRFSVTGDLAGTGDRRLTLDLASRYDLIDDVPDDQPNHNGGTLRFGPDGMLYASFGEDGTPCAAQDTVSLRGVILRLDVTRLPDGPGSASRDLVTPADNPFASSSRPNTRLIWAFGLRNPFRFEIDPESGEVFISDVGQDRFEEMDRAGSGGLDFGWPIKEGPADYQASCPGLAPGPLTGPIFWYDRSAVGGGAAVAITAGVYRPPLGAQLALPSAYVGNLFVSDFFVGHLWRLVGAGDAWAIAPAVPGQPDAEHWAEGLVVVSDYAIGPDGALWYCKQAADLSYPPRSGQVRRIVGTESPPDTIPRPLVPGIAFGPARPVPSAGPVHLDFTLPRIARVELKIFDVRGRLVRLLVPSTPAFPGPHSRIWDGRDDHDVRASSGLYFARLTVDGNPYVQRVMLVR